MIQLLAECYLVQSKFRLVKTWRRICEQLGNKMAEEAEGNIEEVGGKEKKIIPQTRNTVCVTLNNVLSLSKVRKSVWAVNINSMPGQGIEKHFYKHVSTSLCWISNMVLQNSIEKITRTSKL